MSKPTELTGMKFGNLRVLSRAGSNQQGKAMWMCECALCGKESVRTGTSMVVGCANSCPCFWARIVKARNSSSAVTYDVLGASITASEIAEIVGVSRDTIYNLIKAGESIDSLFTRRYQKWTQKNPRKNARRA